MEENKLFLLLGILTFFSLLGMFTLTSGGINDITGDVTFSRYSARTNLFGPLSRDYKKLSYYNCYDRCDKLWQEKVKESEEEGFKYYYGTLNYGECLVECRRELVDYHNRLPAVKFYRFFAGKREYGRYIDDFEDFVNEN